MSITLSDLIAQLPAEQSATISGDDTVMITAPVVEDARLLEPGGVFVARRGLSTDGHQFIPQAVKKGAAAIVGEIEPPQDLACPYVQVKQPQQAIGVLAAAYYGFPSRHLTVIGVTGTDGKTTTSTLIHSVLNAITGGQAGYISTISADLGAEAEDTGLHVTTPGAPRVQYFLDRMVQNGLRYCVLEMTSHGLAQHRLNGVDLDIAVLTNITHEHLDFHGTFENYRAAKGMMFAMLGQSFRKDGQPKVAIINADDPNADFFAAFPADRIVRYGQGDRADLQATHITLRPDGTRFDVAVSNQMSRYQLDLVGAFNVYNALAAIAVGQQIAGSRTAIQSGLSAVRQIAGRMERINEGQDFTAIVDFAHTPNALANALQAVRATLPESGRLIAVFGSAGLRDVEKRRLMAETSARLADMTVLTAEDPRTESLDEILAMMADGCRSQGGVEGETFIRVPDRGEALYQACQMARAGDVVIACGKGHEQSMCFGTVEHAWDDRDALRSALRGEPLRTLPTAR